MNQLKNYIILSVFLGGPTWALGYDLDHSVGQVLTYGKDQKSQSILARIQTDQGIGKESILEAFRCHSEYDVCVPTGTIKVQDVKDQQLIGRIIVSRTEKSKELFPDYPNIMAGDSLQLLRVKVAQKQNLVPEQMFTYNDLFVDPAGSPSTFELSPEGKKRLEKELRVFADKRISLLLVKGFTDQKGPLSANQVESYQRAFTIKQYLVNVFGFDGERVVALGMGESSPRDPSLVMASYKNSRRIEISAVSVSD